MQLNEIGSGHGSGAHHVTSCLHNHSHIDKVGEMGAAASAARQAQSVMAEQDQVDARFSLTAWLDKTFNGGRRLWGSFRGDIDAAGAAEAGRESAGGREAEQVMAVPQPEHSPGGTQILHTPQIAAAASAMQTRDVHGEAGSPAAESPGRRKGKLWRRARERLQNMAGQLTGRSAGRPSDTRTGNPSRVRRESPVEDLRRQSKSRRDEVVLNCALADDSYLLDSYDRKGAYSKLSAEK